MSKNLATLCYELPKVKKAYAAKVCKELFEKTDNQDDREALAAMYKYFLPKTTVKKIKTPEQWVSLAVSEESARPYIQAPYYDAEVKAFVATNGHLIIVHYTNKGTESGFMDNEGQEFIETHHQFPDWQRVIPKFDNTVQTKINVEVIDSLEKEELPKALGVWINGECFNLKYINTALALHGEATIATSSEKKGYPSILTFDGVKDKAAIMPTKK